MTKCHFCHELNFVGVKRLASISCMPFCMLAHTCGRDLEVGPLRAADRAPCCPATLPEADVFQSRSNLLDSVVAVQDNAAIAVRHPRCRRLFEAVSVHLTTTRAFRMAL